MRAALLFALCALSGCEATRGIAEKPDIVIPPKPVAVVQEAPIKHAALKPARPTTIIAGVPVSELASYTQANRLWRNFLIPPKIKREALIELAQSIHRTDPNSNLDFFSDDAKFKQFRLSMQHYPDDAYPSPEEWLELHHIAMVNGMGESGGLKWELLTCEGGTYLSSHGAVSEVIALLE